MTEQSSSFQLKNAIPAQIVNEGASIRQLDLKQHIQAVEGRGGTIRYRMELADGRPFPKGLICTTDGVLSGIAGAETQGNYVIKVIATNDEAESFTTEFTLTIHARPEVDNSQLFKKLKAEVWEALGKNLPLPEMQDILDRPITAVEIYYLLERFATLTIWDVYNLEQPGSRTNLTLQGMSEHYHVYDRGCCIVGVPKDLFSHKRTLADALKTATVMAREAYKRGWVIEFAGFDKMVRRAWVELQLLADEHGKRLEVLHFTPTSTDIQIYQKESKAKGPSPEMGA